MEVKKTQKIKEATVKKYIFVFAMLIIPLIHFAFFYVYINASSFLLSFQSPKIYVYEQVMKYKADQPVYFAGVLLAAVPCFLLFFIFQNSIMQTVHLGGIKG